MGIERFENSDQEPFRPHTPETELNQQEIQSALTEVRKELTHDYRTGNPITPEAQDELNSRLSIYKTDGGFQPYNADEEKIDPRIKALNLLRNYVWIRSNAISNEAEQNSASSAALARESDRNRREAHNQASEFLARLRPDIFRGSHEAVEYIKDTLGDIVDKATARSRHN